MPRLARGVAASCAVLVLVVLLGGCGGAVDLDAPELDAEDAAACADLVSALPPSLAGESPREVDPADAPGAAYGDPAIIVTCGVGEPEDFDQFAQCQLANGVGWFVPDAQMTDEPTEITLTAVGYRPRVEVVVPEEYWPIGAASVQAELADAVRTSLDLVARCR